MVVNAGYQHPPQGGNHSNSSQGAGPSHIDPTIYMMEADVSTQTQAKKYETPGSEPTGKKPMGTSANPLQIDKPTFDYALRPPKASIKHTTHNPNARATQNYSVVKDLAQAPCAMSILEVLQSCPVQRSTLLSMLVVQDPINSNTISFSTQGKPRLPPHVPIQIHVAYKGVNIRRTVVDEGSSTCVMSLSCLKGLGSLEIVPFQSMLKSFDGHASKPHGIVLVFPIMLGGKTVTVEVEVIDAPIDYNLLFGRSWTYAMEAIPSSYFRCIKFPHEGKLITIDQLSFYNAPNESRTAVPLVDNSTLGCENMGVGLYSSLMKSFNISTPILSIKSFPIYALTQVT